MPLLGTKTYRVLNHSKPRIDGYDKVTGRARYANDFSMEGMLYGAVLRSGRASAKVVSINTDAAKALPGVHAVVTFADMEPTTSWAGYPYLTGTVRYYGDCIAMVAAETRELADKALAAIVVEYENLPAVFTIKEALAADAHVVQERFPDNIFTDSIYHLKKGDVDQGFAEADFILEREYNTQYVEHNYMEPETILAYEHPNDGAMTVVASAQNPFFTRRYAAHVLKEPVTRIRMIQAYLGGSFGGKEEAVGMLTGRTAYLSRITGKPVKMIFTREDTLLESSKRHPFTLRYKVGLKKDGRIVAWQGEQICNSGAYNNQSQFMNWRANAHSLGAYEVNHVSTKTFGVFTNNVHSGAFRGYSSPQLLFAQEQLIDELAQSVGMDEIAFRKKNCLRSGSSTGTGMIVDNVVLEEMIDYTCNLAQYHEKKTRFTQENQHSNIKKGIGIAISHRSCGLGGEAPDAAGCMMMVNEDGSISINSGLAENGQGLRTAFAQIAAEAMCVPYESITFYCNDSQSIPDCGMTVASRGTTQGAQSVRKAGESLKALFLQHAADLHFFGDTPSEKLEMEDGEIFCPDDPSKRVPLGSVANACLWTGKQTAVFEWHTPPPLGQDRETGQGLAAQTFSYSCVVAEVAVHTDSGEVELRKVWSSHDVGTAVNPALVKGQVYGGIAMGQGYAVMESIHTRKGQVINKNNDSNIIPTALDIPAMEVSIFECAEESKGTYGAKSVGEPATECIAAAVANAVANATGQRFRNNPLDRQSILATLRTTE